ncbi:MAG: hypothetical protein KC731_10275, partial [Myxococcales bacterium]|nr:hypothetical protein [Myxococcales bacterium]
MLPFVPYPKIAESVADWPDDDAAIRARGRLTWAATEKIHGANLCLCGDGEHVAVAKRRRLLAPDEGFFDHRAAVGGLYAAVGELVAKLRARLPVASLQIHGELFGGAYPHHEIPDGVQAVQTGIAYSPDLRFLAFDLAVVDDRGRAAFLPLAEAVELLEAAGIASVPLLATGPLHELLALPADFESRVPAMLGLPPLPDNRAEGLVIRPWDAELEGARPMVKRKRAAFSDARYHAAEAWATPHPGDALDAVERLGLELLDDERLASAISKVGPSDGRPERTRELIAELTADLRRDVERLAGAALLSL